MTAWVAGLSRWQWRALVVGSLAVSCALTLGIGSLGEADQTSAAVSAPGPRLVPKPAAPTDDPQGHPSAFCAAADRQYQAAVLAARTQRSLVRAGRMMSAANDRVQSFDRNGSHGQWECSRSPSSRAAEDTVQAQWCGEWDRTMTARYRRVHTRSSYYRAWDGSGRLRPEWYWWHNKPADCQPSTRQVTAKHRAYTRTHPPFVTRDTGSGGGSVTANVCIGHHLRVCVRS